MAVSIWVLLGLPLALAAVCAVQRGLPWTRWLPVLSAVVLLVVGGVLVWTVGASGALSTASGLLRVDALSAWMLLVVGAVAVVALWGGLDPEPATGWSSLSVGSRQARPAEGSSWLDTLLCLFLAAMTLAVVADNIGLMWVAIELTTITTAFLVASKGGRHALEAAWKYVVLGAVGVAIAFLGITLLSAASLAAGEATVSWVALLAHASQLDPTLTRVAGALAALGFATKAGLAPMHSWLPDAHSQAPAPVSGLMSGVLLSVAFYVILRIQAITDAAVGPGLMRTLLLTAGLLSLAVTAGLVLTQKDYKRLLAYSSIEHMGLLALGAAAGGPLAIAAVLLHMLGHGLVKSSMFLLAGRILSYTGSHRVADVRNLLRLRPDLGAPFLLGAAALLGFPPFVTFFTEVGIIVAGFQRGLLWPMLVACVLLLVVFAGIARHALAMTLGADAGPTSAELDEALGALRQAQGALVGLGGSLALRGEALAGVDEALGALRQAQDALRQAQGALVGLGGSLAGREGTLAELGEALGALRQAQDALRQAPGALRQAQGSLVGLGVPATITREERTGSSHRSLRSAREERTSASRRAVRHPHSAPTLSVPIALALAVTAILGFVWPLLGPLTAAVAALGGAG